MQRTKKKMRKLIAGILFCMLFVTGCGVSVDITSGGGKKYDKEAIMEKCNFEEVSERESDIHYIPCVIYRKKGARSKDNLESRLDFYVFDSSQQAFAAFVYMADEWLEGVDEQGNRYVMGWLSDVCDANIKEIIYLSDNVVITSDMAVYSTWSEDSPDYGDPWDDKSYQQDVIDYLERNW